MPLAVASTGLPLLRQVAYLSAALVGGSAIGVEREWRYKNAGLRTHAIVSMGAALFVIISKYGFSDVAGARGVSFDPSRVAAQVVTGVGFLGAGLIFVHHDTVKGLTTAATVWLTAAVGAAAGAGLVPIAAVVTAAYLVVAVGFRLLEERVIEPIRRPQDDGEKGT